MMNCEEYNNKFTNKYKRRGNILIKEIIYYLYLISGTVIAVVSIIALKQLSIAKTQLEVTMNSIEISSQRDAAVFTAKQCEYFASEIIKDSDDIENIFIEKDILRCKLPEDYEVMFETNCNAWFKKYNGIIKSEDSSLHKQLIVALNKLEAFSMYFTHGICDTRIAYLPIAHIYVDIVELYYPFIYEGSLENKNNYTDIIKLYKIWKGDLVKQQLELKKIELQIQLSEAEAQASAVKDVSVNPIGTTYKKKNNKKK
jgi:hypothetical protein